MILNNLYSLYTELDLVYKDIFIKIDLKITIFKSLKSEITGNL
jgi:hypothetical protein